MSDVAFAVAILVVLAAGVAFMLLWPNDSFEDEDDG